MDRLSGINIKFTCSKQTLRVKASGQKRLKQKLLSVQASITDNIIHPPNQPHKEEEHKVEQKQKQVQPPAQQNQVQQEKPVQPKKVETTKQQGKPVKGQVPPKKLEMFEGREKQIRFAPGYQLVQIQQCFTPLKTPVQEQYDSGGIATLFATAIIILAARLGRFAYSEEALNHKKLQKRLIEEYESRRLQEMNRHLESGMAQARRQQEVKYNIDAYKKKAEEENRKKESKEQQLKLQAQKEEEQLNILREQQRQEFEKKENEMQIELQQRKDREREARQQKQDQQRREAEELKRQQEEQERLRIQYEREQQEAAHLLQEQERMRRQQEKNMIDKMKTRYSIAFIGDITIEKPRQGDGVMDSIQEPPLVNVTVKIWSMLDIDNYSIQTKTYTDFEDAQLDSVTLVGHVANMHSRKYLQHTLEVQQMLGHGPLTIMSPYEADHWLRTHTSRIVIDASKSIIDKIGTIVRSRDQRIDSWTQSFQVKTQRGVLQGQHEMRAEALIDNAIQCIISKNLQQTFIYLQEIWEDEYKYVQLDVLDNVQNFFFCQMLSVIWLIRAGQTRSQEVPLFVQKFLIQQLQSIGKDTVTLVLQAVQQTIPQKDSLQNMLNTLININTSQEVKKYLSKKQQLRRAKVEARRIEQSEEEKQTMLQPLPEKVWALRNVAATLALVGSGKSGEKNQAKNFIEQAIALKQDYYKADQHPSLLIELESLAQILESSKEWQEQSSKVRERILDILNMLQKRYQEQNDLKSAATVLEAAILSQEQYLGIQNPKILQLSQACHNIIEKLSQEDQNEVQQKRNRLIYKEILDRYTEVLDANKTSKTIDYISNWNSHKSLDPI